MADIQDVTTVIASALTEVSVNGTLEVSMDGSQAASTVGQTATGEDVEVIVVVKPIDPQMPIAA